MKILLGQLNSNGDCLLATTVAKQIKQDYKDASLTWAIGSCCRHIINNNPYVDEVWEIPLPNAQPQHVIKAWETFTTEAQARKEKGEFNLVFYTQYSYGHFKNFMGVTRASIFAGYPGKITVPIKPVISLTGEEIKNVEEFALRHKLHSFKKVVLFESVANSGQSFLNDDFVYELCERISAFPDICLVVSSNKKIISKGSNVIDASLLSFRENVELTKYCHLFVGVSSGISWLCTADSAKDIPKIILINKDSLFASMVLDHKYFGIKRDNILEINQCTPEALMTLIIKDFVSNNHISEETFERICFYNPAAHYFASRNIYRVFKIFLKAPSLKIKFHMLKAFLERILSYSKKLIRR